MSHPLSYSPSNTFPLELTTSLGLGRARCGCARTQLYLLQVRNLVSALMPWDFHILSQEGTWGWLERPLKEALPSQLVLWANVASCWKTFGGLTGEAPCSQDLGGSMEGPR